MRYWWVNHKQTAREELGGGFLWAPKREANGARSQFYDNMRRAEPGDVVLSFSGGMIGHVGKVQDFARPALKPTDFGTAGENWSQDGWLLPVVWQALPAPVHPKTRINKLGPLLPLKYSPIHPISGNGNQKAYLAEISRPAFELLIVGAQEIVDAPIGANAAIDVLRTADDTIERALESDASLDTTTRRQSILARQGQGIFRLRVTELESACRLTGVRNLALLVASHIKPWRACKTAVERLDGANGLLLAPHVDRLFDRGLIGFEPSGRVLLSSYLDPLDLGRLGLREACSRNCGAFHERQSHYLRFHLQNVFLP